MRLWRTLPVCMKLNPLQSKQQMKICTRTLSRTISITPQVCVCLTSIICVHLCVQYRRTLVCVCFTDDYGEDLGVTAVALYDYQAGKPIVFVEILCASCVLLLLLLFFKIWMISDFLLCVHVKQSLCLNRFTNKADFIQSVYIQFFLVSVFGYTRIRLIWAQSVIFDLFY